MPEQASLSSAQLQNGLHAKFAGQVDANICNQSNYYSCSHKIFSGTLDYSEKLQDFGCSDTAIGTHICLTGPEFTYNSAAAEKICAQNHCTEDYEFEEYSCEFNLKNDSGAAPLRAEGPDLASVLSAVQADCTRTLAPTPSN